MPSVAIRRQMAFSGMTGLPISGSLLVIFVNKGVAVWRMCMVEIDVVS